ncbi:MAG: hypothetical protein ACRYFR_14690 [Janthinobacterium lividum]
MAKGFWGLIPTFIGLACCAVLFQYLTYYAALDIPDYKEIAGGNLLGSQTKAIELINESNKFLISINTALFGLAGFFINSYREMIRRYTAILPYLCSLLLLSVGYVFAFRAYSELIADLSQNVLDIHPASSTVLFYLRAEFVACCSSSITLLSTLAFVLFSQPPTAPKDEKTAPV